MQDVTCDVDEKAKVFAKMISRIDLTWLSPLLQTEYWRFVKEYSELFITEYSAATLACYPMKSDGNAMEQKPGPSPNFSSTYSGSSRGHLRLLSYASDGQHDLWDMPVIPSLLCVGEPMSSFNRILVNDTRVYEGRSVNVDPFGIPATFSTAVVADYAMAKDVVADTLIENGQMMEGAGKTPKSDQTSDPKRMESRALAKLT
ncbi:hypothetical protein EGR_10046 [Echinococcus granulosus]|uniref:Uncharacterized protein n=1 Tax=Echinococcus granulosus TaxID=6210 RepID=W6UNW2_ECHGR|nr:hypothetical protein EGR_10046 [Echinococcus granulosus]EUB55079.1 hypothetical protein EGR_10046 [Echinococcus granulosus]